MAQKLQSAMDIAIKSWLKLYKKADSSNSLRLASSISSEMARLTTLELKFEIKPKSKSTSDIQRVEFLNAQMKPIMDNLRIYTEYALAGGGLMFKPYINNEDEITIDVLNADKIKPLAVNSSGEIIACEFVEKVIKGTEFYSRVETHSFTKTSYVVTNKAYKSASADYLGSECSLSEIDEWSELTQSQELHNIPLPLFSYFKIPLGNTIDMHSPLGVSIYARAVDLINEIDEQWSRFNWEFEAGEATMEAPKDAFPQDKEGNPIIPKGKERLFWLTEFDSERISSKITELHTPSLREQSLVNGLNTMLQRLEFEVGLAYGTISQPTQIEKTATEIKTSKQRSYATVSDVQKSLDVALKNLVTIIDTYATLYELVPIGQYEIQTVWDDSIIVDAEEERNRDMNEVRAGLMQKWEYRVKWYGEDEKTAKANSVSNDPSSFSLS